jgi:3-hydroxymyristoyl/3-hydroxydecanoyl-(acyl carrier protein) dehydratase
MKNRNKLLNFNRLELIKQIDEGDISSWRINWIVPEDLNFFNGHFPNDPILPSVVILEASLELIELFFGDKKLFLKEVKTAKFFSPIKPGLKIRITGLMKGHKNNWAVNWIEENKGYKLAAFSLSLDPT